MILGNRIFKAPVESRLHMINIAFIFSNNILFIHDKNMALYIHENAYASYFTR
jgi:hypothetical protein